MFCSLSKRKKEPKFKMNTQFNSNVIWLQLEYKISTLRPLVNIFCEFPLTTTTKPSTLFFKIWQRFSQNLKKHRTSQECNFSLAAWSSSDKLLFSLPKAWTTISNSSIFLSLAECECSCSNRSLYLAVKSAYWLLASSSVVEGTLSASA